jgi:thiol-disulfide isomerase/thioredoxin
MMRKTVICLGIILHLMHFSAQAEPLKTGSWRFELRTTYAAVPFIIDFSFNKNQLQGKLINGEEVIPLTQISHKGKKISIPLQNYEVSLELNQDSSEQLSGNLIRHNKDPKVMTPVIGVAGVSERFPKDKKAPSINLTGRWSITLTEDNKTEAKGVALFKQEGQKLTGSILTPTGDYRYLEGYVEGNQFEAASFDGVYNYLLSGRMDNDQLTAEILTNYKTKISGIKNDQAELPDAYAQTQLPNMFFAFPDLKGKTVSLKDARFKNKPVIVTFFGSWCPNCMDEMNFLIPWYKENHKRGIEVVALAFERSVNEAQALKQLKKVQKVKDIPFPLLVAGVTSDDKPAQKISGLKNFISFPTTVFLNKRHEVLKVHAGFTGPSTGEFFERWKKDFNQNVAELLK